VNMRHRHSPSSVTSAVPSNAAAGSHNQRIPVPFDSDSDGEGDSSSDGGGDVVDSSGSSNNIENPTSGVTGGLGRADVNSGSVGAGSGVGDIADEWGAHDRDERHKKRSVRRSSSKRPNTIDPLAELLAHFQHHRRSTSSSKKTLSSPSATVTKPNQSQSLRSSLIIQNVETPLTVEEKTQEETKRILRSIFVQDMLISTLLPSPNTTSTSTSTSTNTTTANHNYYHYYQSLKKKKES